MPSEKQLLANRRNAKKSTGPRSSTGKRIAKRNAITHGLLAKDVLIDGEDSEDYRKMFEALREQLAPEGAIEEQLADRVAGALWRLRRLGKVEAGVFTFQALTIAKERASHKIDNLRGYDISKLVNFGTPSRTRDESERIDALAQEIHKTDEELARPLPSLGAAFIEDVDTSNALSKLSRYEAALEKSLYRALHELQRLQAARHSGQSATPIAVDITIDGEAT